MCLVGWTGVKEDWHSLPSQLSSSGYDVLVFDHRGFGESSAHQPTKDESYTLELLADDTARLIQHVFPDQRVHVLGISMGGMVAQLVAGRHTSLVKSLILGCTTISVLEPIRPPVLTPIPLPSPMPQTQEGQRSLVRTLLGHNFTTKWVSENVEYFEFLLDQSFRWKRPMDATQLQSLAIGRFNGLPIVPSILDLPTMILHGTSDRVIPYEQGQVLSEHLPKAEFVSFQDVGHLFWNQVPEETNKAITNFLTKHDEQEDQTNANGDDAAASKSNRSAL